MAEAGKEVEVQVNVCRRQDGLYTVTMNRPNTGAKRTGCTWDEALKMIAEVAPPAVGQLGGGLLAGSDAKSVTAAAKLPEDPFLRLETLRHEIQDAQTASRPRSLEAGAAARLNAALGIVGGPVAQGSPRHMLDATHSAGSGYQSDHLSTAEAVRLVSQVLQFVLSRS